jgi:hypothetical protein
MARQAMSLALFHMHAGDVARALRYLDESEALARELGDTALTNEALGLRGHILYFEVGRTRS